MVQFLPIEVVSKGAGIAKHSFSGNANLEAAKKIVGIEAYKVGDVSTSIISGADLVSDAVFLKSFVTLRSKTFGGREVISKMPLVDLHRPTNNGMLQFFNIDGQLSMADCYIEVATTAGQDATDVWVLGFHYEEA